MQPTTATPWPDAARAEARPSRTEFGRFALWAGLVGFGGGLSVLGILRSTAIERHHWLTEREFDSTATVAQMLPGGAAANMLSLVGLRFFGPRGAVVGHAAFIFPGFVATLVLAYAYQRLGGVPTADALLGGLSAAIVGIVGSLTLHMVRTSIDRFWQMGIAAAALAMSVEGGASSGEVAFLGIAAGLIVDLGLKRARLARSRRASQPPPPVRLPDEGELMPPPDPPTLRAVAWPIASAAVLLTVAGGALFSLGMLFLRTGLGAYGGGFAIVPHLKATLVGTGSLTDRQFADAVAIGKLTPGPVLLMATFIGYVKEGLAGALVATTAIFAAPLVLTIALGRWLARHRSRRSVRAALRGLTPAVVGMMAAAALTLAMSLDGTRELAIAVAVGMTLTRFRVNPVLMLVIGGAAGALLSRVG